jgi:hypothetical protein
VSQGLAGGSTGRMEMSVDPGRGNDFRVSLQIVPEESSTGEH